MSNCLSGLPERYFFLKSLDILILGCKYEPVKSRFPCLLVLLLASLCGTAQRKIDTGRVHSRGLMLSIQFGTAEFYLPELDGSLEANGIPAAFGRPGIKLGGELSFGDFTDKSRFFYSIGLEGTGYTETAKHYQLQVSVLENNYTLNYLLFRNSRFFLFPSLGWGMLNDYLNIINQEANPGSFGGAIDSLQGERSLALRELFIIRPGIHMDWATDKGQAGLIGINITDDIGITRRSWKMKDGTALAGAPRSRAEGWSLSVSFTLE